MAGLFAQGPERLEQALEFAQNATGSALREHERSMDSVAFKAQTAANEMTKFWQTTINVEFIKMFYDSLANIVRGITAVADSIGLLPPILAIAATSYMALNAAMRTSAIIKGQMLIYTIQGLSAQYAGLAVALNTASTSTTIFGAAKTKLIAILGVLNVALASTIKFLLGIALPVVGILAITYGITKTNQCNNEKS